MKRIALDSNVLVSALDPQDLFHAECLPIFTEVVSGSLEAICPTIVLVETVCVIRRRTNDEDIARRVAKSLVGIPGLHWRDFSMEAAARAASLGIRSGLRAADAVIVSTAEIEGVPLLTKDREIDSRAPRTVEIVDPGHWP